ncbi:MAG: NAD(P)H-binding protein, partial [Clostridia bacterium]|nr:NAD(P)H-binding protein [Clostridia bacterium]
MKIVLAGAFGNLGAEILKSLCAKGHDVIAADLKERKIEGTEGKYRFVSIDATNPATLEGLCDGADAVITTMGLTTSSTRFTSYDIDYQGNINLYQEAIKAGVKKFNYISVISCDEKGAEKVPMLHAKKLVEDVLKSGSMDYVIYRPTGYFYDIAKVFKPYIDKGEMQLLKGFGGVKANVVDCHDFADFIVEHMNDTNVTYNVGGKETYSYIEMAEMCFKAAGQGTKIKYAPIWLFPVLAHLP